MNNLKTLTALAAVMLAGLAAPMATATHGSDECPSSGYTDLSIGMVAQPYTVASDGERVFRLDLGENQAATVTINPADQGSNVLISVWAYDGTCGSVTPVPVPAGQFAALPETAYFFHIEDADASGSENILVTVA